MPIKYLMDENVDPIYQIQSRRKEPDLVVWAIGDPNTPLKSTLVPDILHRCERYSYCIVKRQGKRGQKLYNSSIRQQVEVGNKGKIVALAANWLCC